MKPVISKRNQFFIFAGDFYALWKCIFIDPLRCRRQCDLFQAIAISKCLSIDLLYFSKINMLQIITLGKICITHFFKIL